MQICAIFDGGTILIDILLGQEGAHAVSQEKDRQPGVFGLNDLIQLPQIFYRSVEAILTHIPHLIQGLGRPAVAAMVIGIDQIPGSGQRLRQSLIPGRLLRHAMGYLNNGFKLLARVRAPFVNENLVPFGVLEGKSSGLHDDSSFVIIGRPGWRYPPGELPGIAR
jgi:hypothetical protein